jgi:hypothetical protein
MSDPPKQPWQLEYAHRKPKKIRRRRRWIGRAFAALGFGWGVWLGFMIAVFGGINAVTSFLTLMLGLCAMIVSEQTARTASRKRPDQLSRRRASMDSKTP